jgi:hypothetical protein
VTLVLDKGQIGLVRTTGFVGHVIRTVEGKHAVGVTHVVVGIGNDLCVGAEPGGARIRPVSYWQPQLVAVSHFDLSDAQRDQIAYDASLLDGTPYNLTDDILIGLLQLAGRRDERWTTKDAPAWVFDRVSSVTSLQCAQLADWVYTLAGLDLFNDGRIPGLVMPGDYVEIFHAHGWPILPQKDNS